MVTDLSMLTFNIKEPLCVKALHAINIAAETHASPSVLQNHKVTSLQDCPLVMTPVEAARILGIGRNSIYALLRCGALRSIRVGKLIKIPKAALEEYLQRY